MLPVLNFIVLPINVEICSFMRILTDCQGKYYDKKGPNSMNDDEDIINTKI